ncbi:Histone deacetylase domain superfamily protein [Abortiporus biennis]
MFVHLLYSQLKISSLLPSNRNRSLLVHSLTKELGLLSTGKNHLAQLRILRPSPATLEDLSSYHTKDYLEFILNEKNFEGIDEYSGPSDHTEYGLEEDCPYFQGLSQYVRMIAGATLSATKALLDGQTDISICWDGGRHHAQKSQASGFCYIADCVLSILALKRSRITESDGSGRKPRILYLDLDLHFSDGVSQAFASSSSTASQVLTLSIHHASPGFFPASPLATLSDPSDPSFDPFTLSLPLCRGASNATYSRIWRIVEQVKDAFNPDYVVVQCGVDSLSGDPYGIFNWSLGDGDGSLGWCIERICSEWGCKVLLLGGGGYNSPNAARAWAYLTSIALGRKLSLETDIPDHAAFPLYAPSFILDVPAGQTQDQNTNQYLSEVEKHFANIVRVLQETTGIVF